LLNRSNKNPQKSQILENCGFADFSFLFHKTSRRLKILRHFSSFGLVLTNMIKKARTNCPGFFIIRKT